MAIGSENREPCSPIEPCDRIEITPREVAVLIRYFQVLQSWDIPRRKPVAASIDTESPIE